MVETDPIQIDKIQRKLRHRYMLLVGLNIIAYLTVIVFCIVGCNKIGGYSGNSYAFDEYWLYGELAGLPGIFALLAFAVCIPSTDTKKMSKKTRKNIKAAQVANAALQVSVGNVTGAANSVSGAMGGTDGFFLGPRARFIAPLFIFGALFLMLGYPPDRIYHDIPEQEEWLLFILLVLAEIFSIAAAMACRVYNRFKYYHTTDKKEADAEDKRITALQNERYRIECEKARELRKHKQVSKKANAQDKIKQLIIENKNVDFDTLLIAVKEYYATFGEVLVKAWNHPDYWIFYGDNGSGKPCIGGQPIAFSKNTGERQLLPLFTKEGNKILSEATEIDISHQK